MRGKQLFGYKVLKFIAYSGIHRSVQLSNPSSGCAGRCMNPVDPADPATSYGLLRILQSSIDSNYRCVYIEHLRPATFSDN
jgi:hypothetical protein